MCNTIGIKTFFLYIKYTLKITKTEMLIHARSHFNVWAHMELTTLLKKLLIRQKMIIKSKDLKRHLTATRTAHGRPHMHVLFSYFIYLSIQL